MTVILQKFKTNRRFTGVSGDTKPVLTLEDVGDEFFETNTSELWVWYGDSWKIPTTVTEVEIPPIELGTAVGQATRVDFTTNDTIIYRAEAEAGTVDAGSVWRIRRLTIASDNDVTEEWANGDASFDKVWDNRVSYTYS